MYRIRKRGRESSPFLVLVVVITGASGGLGEASDRRDFQGCVQCGSLCRLACLALNHIQPVGKER
jgi:hypothetical protein